MNWIDVNDTLMLNLDGIRAIAQEDDLNTRIFASGSESFVAPIQYDVLRSIIKQRRSLESAAKDSFTKSMKSLAKGQRTPVP